MKNVRGLGKPDLLIWFKSNEECIEVMKNVRILKRTSKATCSQLMTTTERS